MKGEKIIESVIINNNSPVDSLGYIFLSMNRYAYEYLPFPVHLKVKTNYSICSSEQEGGDRWLQESQIRENYMSDFINIESLYSTNPDYVGNLHTVTFLFYSVPELPALLSPDLKLLNAVRNERYKWK